MPQLLESTRNYLRSSTKIGRRLSSYRDDSRSASEASLQDMNTTTSTTPSSAESLKLKQPQQQQHRPTTQNRLSSLFSLEGRNRNSISSEDRAATATATSTALANATPLTGGAKVGRDHDITPQKKRRSFHSRKSSQHQQEKHHRFSSPDLYTDGKDVPRGRSPTLSVSHTDYTAGSGSSSYDARPSDYPTLKQYQAHVWRRNLLEESIMHSLRLGYGETGTHRPHSSSRHRSRSRSLKGSTNGGRSRKMSREQHSAMLVAAMSKDLPPCPTGDGTTPVTVVLSRSGPVPSKDGKKSAKNGNSPYQMLLNPSTTNVTHSFASFTLELDEHQVSHVMNSSAIPGLFTIKVGPSRQRGRANSTARMMATTGHGPSTRVLTGKTTM
ncbi:hypothetical protein BG015_007880 [Linnemannia schmuckeri]|uniref:Uncharacterized protein n=1 Tax=Linnemannia schmuckeri TaxID=64567 RepID=A0A9P5S9R4_9FUNG|nr:hypothetical protein BG015_007880 [Linnemannia schmuckeri]